MNEGRAVFVSFKASGKHLPCPWVVDGAGTGAGGKVAGDAFTDIRCKLCGATRGKGELLERLDIGV